MPISTAALSASQLDRLISRLANDGPVGSGEDAIAEFAGDGRATITFSPGTCLLSRSGGQNVIAAAEDRAGLAEVQEALDNMLLGGRVLDPAGQGEHHKAIRRLNDLITADQRFDSVLLPVRDGFTVARKR